MSLTRRSFYRQNSGVGFLGAVHLQRQSRSSGNNEQAHEVKWLSAHAYGLTRTGAPLTMLLRNRLNLTRSAATVVCSIMMELLG